MSLTKARSAGPSWAAIGVAAGATLLIPLWTRAAETAPDFRNDAVELWTARALAWVIAAAIAVVVWLLVSELRNGRSGVRNRPAMLLGVVVLPIFCVASGMLLVFMRAERVEFCSSCHRVMQAYVDDMTDPDGGSLAAVHFANRYIPTNQCYECHTSYGLFGTVRAKWNGIREVYRYYTRNYSQPITMWHPYSNSDCLKCHAGSRSWLALAAHTTDDMTARLYADETSCMACHDAAHRVRTRGGREAHR